MSIGFYPSFVTQFFNRSLTTATHIMTQTKGMSNFVRRHKANQITHQVIIKLHAACTWVCSGSLHHIPVMYQFHYVMVPTDMTFQDLTTSRIVYIRTISILNRRCEIADHRITGIFQTHGSVVFWPLFTHDSIFETGFFKGFLPIVYTQDQVFSPLLRSSRIDIIDNWFFRLNKFTFFPFFNIFIFWFQSPTNSKFFVFNFLLIITKKYIIICEETYALISDSRSHWFFRQQ